MTPASPLRLSTVAFRPGSLRSLFLICMLLTVGSAMSAGWQVAIKAEHGALELASFVCLATAALVSGSFYREGVLKLWAVPVVFALLALREMDFQNWWFEPGLLRTGIFSAPVPIWQKVVSAGVMLFILFALLTLLIKGARPCLSAIRARKKWGILVLASGFYVVVAILLDGVETNLAVVNVSISRPVAVIASYLEEIMEFGFAFSLMAASVVFAREKRGSLPEQS